MLDTRTVKAPTHEANLLDLANEAAVNMPPHLLELLELNEYGTIEELRGDIISAAENERDSIWQSSDRCALMRALLPFNNPDGTINHEGRKVVGWLASDLGVSGQTVRRYMALGTHYPPNWIDESTGEIIALRDAQTPMNLYLAGLKALDHDMKPADAVVMALENEWSAGQLKKWIVDGSYRENGEQPPVNRVWFKETFEQPTQLDAKGLLNVAKQAIEQEFIRLAKHGQRPLHVRVTVTALEPAEVKK